MHPPTTLSDDGNMGDSAYELINSTDGESQDDRMTESISSLDYPRTDDVQSLSGSVNDYHTDTDTDEEAEHHSSASSIRFAEQALDNPSSQLPSHSLEFRPTPEASILPQSIEFLEAGEDKDGPVYLEKISVKHTIREFSEEETATIAKDMGLSEAPKRLVATIRQTMSQGCLSTREPLRVLYSGSPVAQKDIIYKLSSAIWASGTIDGRGKVAYRNTDGIYNIVPISSFGSTKMPEIELMESSGYQIRIEHCTSADEIIIEGSSFPGDTVYSITIDQERTYRSLFSPSGSIIQPKWTLPHIAIFFITENDDEQAEQTRNFAWEFMSRHGVPSIFISNSQTFKKPLTGRWRDFVDQHAVHLCLESRDPERPVLSQRLPIDLTSFLNIDARQMNRNVTYLTGLSDSNHQLQEEKDGFLATTKDTLVPAEQTTHESMLGESSTFLCKSRACVRDYIDANQQWLVPLAMAILGGFLAMVLTALPFADQVSSPQPRVASTNSLALVSTARSAIPTLPVSTATTTIIINVTSTKTVNIQHADASASTLASALSFAGFLSDKASTGTSEPEARKTVCSVELYGSNEILVRIPSGGKATWLARGAIDIDVFRGEEHVKSKLSSIDEGILVEINKKDAYGVLNVSVITTRKPKINETFEVNFGKPVVVEAFEAGILVLQDMADRVVHTADEAVNIVEGACIPAIAAMAEKLRGDAASLLGHMKGAGQAAQSLSQRVTDDANPQKVARLLKDAQKHVSDQFLSLDVRGNAELAVLKAQIASKLWWLRMQGKTKEHTNYEQRASEFLKKKSDEFTKSRKTARQDSSQEECGGRGQRTHRCCKKKACASSRGKTKDSRWRKMIVG